MKWRRLSVNGPRLKYEHGARVYFGQYLGKSGPSPKRRGFLGLTPPSDSIIYAGGWVQNWVQDFGIRAQKIGRREQDQQEKMWDHFSVLRLTRGIIHGVGSHEAVTPHTCCGMHRNAVSDRSCGGNSR